jgi:hypothetical protein
MRSGLKQQQQQRYSFCVTIVSAEWILCCVFSSSSSYLTAVHRRSAAYLVVTLISTLLTRICLTVPEDQGSRHVCVGAPLTLSWSCSWYWWNRQWFHGSAWGGSTPSSVCSSWQSCCRGHGCLACGSLHKSITGQLVSFRVRRDGEEGSMEGKEVVGCRTSHPFTHVPSVRSESLSTAHTGRLSGPQNQEF